MHVHCTYTLYMYIVQAVTAIIAVASRKRNTACKFCPTETARLQSDSKAFRQNQRSRPVSRHRSLTVTIPSARPTTAPETRDRDLSRHVSRDKDLSRGNSRELVKKASAGSLQSQISQNVSHKSFIKTLWWL